MLHPLIHSFKKCLLSFHQNTTMLHTVDIQNESFDTLLTAFQFRVQRVLLIFRQKR